MNLKNRTSCLFKIVLFIIFSIFVAEIIVLPKIEHDMLKEAGRQELVTVQQLCGAVLEKNPDVEQDFILGLRQPTKSWQEKGEQILNQYGYDEEHLLADNTLYAAYMIAWRNWTGFFLITTFLLLATSLLYFYSIIRNSNREILLILEQYLSEDFSIVSGEAIRNEQLSDFGEYPVYGGGEIIGFCSQYNTSEGSLIIGRVGARCGCVTHTTCKSWATDNALIVLPTCNAKYMYYVIGHCQLNNLNTSNAQPLITSTKIKNVVVPYFSDAMQQQEIADYLDAKCAKIDGLIAKKEQLVKELESYKKSLIYEVVTGKREV